MATELADRKAGYACPVSAKNHISPVRSAPARIIENPAFQEVLRKGSWEAMHRFTAENQEEIKRILRGRLQIRIGPEYASVPEGRVLDEMARHEKRMDAHFVEGRLALRAADYSRAADCFSASSELATGFNQIIARNYQAYALLRTGETLRARMILSPLCRDVCRCPSAYWNLACCMPDENQQEKLQILGLGINKAPHPALLYGAVQLGISIGHSFLTHWLSCLPMAEALLLAQYLRYDKADAAEKEAGLLRLGAYAYHGEPRVPDPLEHLISPQITKEFFEAMFQRQKHSEVVDFWFRCRRRIAYMRYDFWKMKADYYELFGRRNRAVNSFKTELYCRLHVLAEKSSFRDDQLFLDATRKRVGIYLCRCMSPDLRSQGEAIYRILARFHKNFSISLLPSDAKLESYFCKEANQTIGGWNKKNSEICLTGIH